MQIRWSEPIDAAASVIGDRLTISIDGDVFPLSSFTNETPDVTVSGLGQISGQTPDPDACRWSPTPAPFKTMIVTPDGREAPAFVENYAIAGGE